MKQASIHEAQTVSANLNKKVKVYVVGTSTGYASFLNHTLVNSIEEADLVLFTGGEDISTALYRQAKGKFTDDPNIVRDSIEINAAEEAMKLKKPIFGTCRGAQLGCALSGGLLVQHMNHPYNHNLRLYDGTIIQTNSLHHQLQNPYNLHPSKYIVAGHSKGLSNIYLNGEDSNIILRSSTYKEEEYYTIEPELVYYRENNWLGIQGHPEMMPYNASLPKLLRRMVDLQIENRLDIVLSLDIPIIRYLDKPLVLRMDEIQIYEQIIEKRIKALAELEIN